MSADLDLFHVCMKDGSVRQMNAEQIDEAFHAGLIDAKSGVVRAGELEWTTLGELAGLDDVTPSPHSVAPVALDDSGDVPAFRPRRGRAFAGFLVAALLVGGVGFAATKARAGHVPRFVTSSFAKLKSLRTTTTTTEAPKAAAVVVAPPPAPAPAPPPAKIEAPKPAPSASANVPTFDPKALPDAKGKSKSKRR